jgi:hypothetical protein
MDYLRENGVIVEEATPWAVGFFTAFSMTRACHAERSEESIFCAFIASFRKAVEHFQH